MSEIETADATGVPEGARDSMALEAVAGVSETRWFVEPGRCDPLRTVSRMSVRNQEDLM